jgi:hypothetical protein
MQSLQQKLEQKTQQLDRAEAAVRRLQTATENDAIDMLIRLRLGNTVDEAVESILRPAEPPRSVFSILSCLFADINAS